jgi:hypothetical protein
VPVIKISDEAVVVRCDKKDNGQYEIGLFFHRMSSELRDSIDYYIEQSLTLTV